MKKIICLIFCLLFSIITLCACSATYENSIIKHSYERDYNQVIATVESITEPGKRFVYNDRHEKIGEEDWSYTSEKVDIYKTQLINYINTYGSTYVNNYGMSYQEMVEYFVEQLVLTELVLIEADYRFEMQEIYWSEEDIDAIQQSVYHTLDDYLRELSNGLLDKAGQDKVEEPTSDDAPSTTYPVPEEEEPEPERTFATFGKGAKHDDWYTDKDREWFTERAENRYSLPGNYGSEEERSLMRESVKRLVTMLYNNTANLINVTDEEKKQIDAEYESLKESINVQGVGYVYSILGKTLMVKKLFGDNAIMSQKMTILQNYIEDSVTVSEQEIVDKYNQMLSDQINRYATVSNYETDAEGDNLILYRPNSNYIYVKHILIPFSEEQQDYLTRIKNENTEEFYKQVRENYVNNIVAYKHVDGEDDKDHPLTVAQIWSEVKAKMAQASADPFVAERTFDELIYKYNTDPGIFGSEYGYAVKYELGEGESEKYMQEFAEAARALRDDGYKVGQMYDKYVITDYGVHFMYYAADYDAGEILSLNSYATSGRYTLVRDKIESDLREAAESAKFNTWRNERIYYYRNIKKVGENKDKDMVTLYVNAYKDLY